LTRVSQWLYKSTLASLENPSAHLDTHYNYDRVLNFNTITKAFYPWTLPNSDDTINGLLAVKGIGVSGETESQVFFYLSSSLDSDTDYDFAFALTRDSNYEDFTSDDYMSYFVTGYKIRGDAIRKFQMNYINVFMDREVGSSCYIQGLWDYSNSASSNRWTNKQQLYFDKNYFDIVRRRVKIRGTGEVLQLKFTSQTGRPFSILGWSAFDTGNSSL
jgi:hypothetical protein